MRPPSLQPYPFCQLPPLTRSMSPSSLRRSATASREVTRPSTSRPMRPPLAANTASQTTPCRQAFEWSASLPPYVGTQQAPAAVGRMCGRGCVDEKKERQRIGGVQEGGAGAEQLFLRYLEEETVAGAQGKACDLGQGVRT